MIRSGLFDRRTKEGSHGLPVRRMMHSLPLSRKQCLNPLPVCFRDPPADHFHCAVEESVLFVEGLLKDCNSRRKPPLREQFRMLSSGPVAVNFLLEEGERGIDS